MIDARSDNSLAAKLVDSAAPCEYALPQARTYVEEVVGLFGSMRKPLSRYALTLGIATADVEEVVQETFLALFKHLRSGKSRQNLPGWAFRVCHNLALRRLERSRGERRLIGTEAERLSQCRHNGLNPEQQILQAQRRARLQSVLRALPEVDRCCISLRAEGLRYREIAETLGISLGAVSTSLTRSLAKFERADKE
jgi:RNA polymerase sigma-70 factor (ECF subfamily)